MTWKEHFIQYLGGLPHRSCRSWWKPKSHYIQTWVDKSLRWSSPPAFLFIVTFLHRIFLHTFFVPPKSSHTHIYIVFFDGSPVAFWCRWAGRQLKGCSSIMKPEHLKILIKSLHFVSVSSKLAFCVSQAPKSCRNKMAWHAAMEKEVGPEIPRRIAYKMLHRGAKCLLLPGTGWNVQECHFIRWNFWINSLGARPVWPPMP